MQQIRSGCTLITLGIVLALAPAVSTVAADEPNGRVIALTDDNFDELTASDAPFFVSVTAPWCPHCRDLEPIWQAVAEKLRGEVHVGKIDGTVERVLLQRFNVEAYPSLYYLRNGETRECTEVRSVAKLVEFAEHGWKNVDAVSPWKSPVSPYGRGLGKARMIPHNIRSYYKYLHHEKKFAVLTLLVGFMSVPVLVGLTSICLLDSYYTRAARLQHRPFAHQHQH